ncbi:hypothetical protein O9992_13095 [Vibrio lentus]|nr:hypothetical protein [Vibrio lentus]
MTALIEIDAFSVDAQLLLEQNSIKSTLTNISITASINRRCFKSVLPLAKQRNCRNDELRKQRGVVTLLITSCF